MKHRKKLIEVALPLDAINKASAREKSIRHGHAGRIADEVVSHLAGLVDAKVHVTLEIEAEIPSGAPDRVVRIVTENSRTLKFASHGFEEE